MNDVDVFVKARVTEEQLNQYNESLPSEAVLQKYIDDLQIYKYKKEANVDFEFSVENNGRCKANDINVTMRFPKELIVLEREDIKNLEEPEKPCRPKNPIEEAYKKTMCGAMEALCEMPSLKYPSLANAIGAENLCYLFLIKGYLHHRQ